MGPSLLSILYLAVVLVAELCSTLWDPHGLQHARLPCSSLSPRVCSNSCPLKRWCYLSHPLLLPSPPVLNLSQHQDLFQPVSSSNQVPKVLQLLHQSFQWIFRVDFLFHSPRWPSSRGCLVPLCFLPLNLYHLHIWGYWYFSCQSWFQLVTHPAWHFLWFTLHRT